jgi:CheY-like chemotaxis protein
LTASSHPNDHAACRAAGMNAVVLKPINKLHLENGVLSALQQGGVAHV